MVQITVADASHIKFSKIICETIADSAKVRGTGIAQRTEEYINQKILNGNAVIALQEDCFAGFCYIEQWGHGKFVANSGLIVHPDFRGIGLAKQIKAKIFTHSRLKYPDAKLFGITTGLAVMKINYSLGYKPVTFSELTDDDQFWKGCKTCVNYDVLKRTERKMCLCTGMLFDPEDKPSRGRKISKLVWSRLQKIKKIKFKK